MRRNRRVRFAWERLEGREVPSGFIRFGDSMLTRADGAAWTVQGFQAAIRVDIPEGYIGIRQVDVTAANIVPETSDSPDSLRGWGLTATTAWANPAGNYDIKRTWSDGNGVSAAGTTIHFREGFTPGEYPVSVAVVAQKATGEFVTLRDTLTIINESPEVNKITSRVEPLQFYVRGDTAGFSSKVILTSEIHNTTHYALDLDTVELSGGYFRADYSNGTYDRVDIPGDSYSRHSTSGVHLDPGQTATLTDTSPFDFHSGLFNEAGTLELVGLDFLETTTANIIIESYYVNGKEWHSPSSLGGVQWQFSGNVMLLNEDMPWFPESWDGWAGANSWDEMTAAGWMIWSDTFEHAFKRR